MATASKLDEDEQLLLGGDEPVLQQPQVQQFVGPPPPVYQPTPTFPPYGAEVAMAPMGGSGHQGGSHTTVIINQVAPPSVRMAPRDWSSSLCSCCDEMGSCLLGTFCPLILGCQVAVEMEESLCVPCCVPGWLLVLRTKMRADNNIQGTVMDDCCTVCCCSPCVLCQMARELRTIRQAYRPQQ